MKFKDPGSSKVSGRTFNPSTFIAKAAPPPPPKIHHPRSDHAKIMQTLWSRIAQSGAAGSACKCPQCLTFAGGLTRRVGAGASRRTPKYLTSSTLWYSGIFAAAATLDAGAKVRRREKWDRAIAEVRQELGKEEEERGGGGGRTWGRF